MSRVFVGMGANQGNPMRAFALAETTLRITPGITVVGCSPLYRSSPHGVDSVQPDYLNGCMELLVDDWQPRNFLSVLQRIEVAAGRQPNTHNKPRCLDLDLLLWGEQVIQTPELSVPHPRMHQRRFVLAPLADLDSDLVVPGKGKVSDLLFLTSDQADDVTPMANHDDEPSHPG